ncbi:hypothetical protein K0U83_03805 [bacterium]|nr:hypothetical protein [bacterium]
MTALDRAVAARTALADQILTLCRDIGRKQGNPRALLARLYPLVAEYEAADLAVVNELIP